MPKLIHRNIITIFICSLAIGCSNPQQVPEQKVRSAYSIVATANSNVHFSKGSSFSWQSNSRPVLGKTRIDKAALGQLLDHSFRKALIKQGYIWKGLSSGAQYQISYIAIAGDAVSDEEINREFRINPGLRTDQRGSSIQNKGTLIVNIVENRSGRSVWQVAMQAYLHVDDEVDSRKQRIARAVHTIVSRMP